MVRPVLPPSYLFITRKVNYAPDMGLRKVCVICDFGLVSSLDFITFIHHLTPPN